MWFLYIPIGILSGLLVYKSRQTSAKLSAKKSIVQRESQEELNKHLSNLALEFEDSEQPAQTVVVAVEEIPLDNRHSDTGIKSEHVFSHTAHASVEIVHDIDGGVKFQTDLLKLLKSEVAFRFGREIAQDIGSRIQREVKLTFHAAARARVYYKVIWKQSMRWGKVTWKMNETFHKIPFVVHYGLFAEVVSIGDDGSESIHNHKANKHNLIKNND